MVTVCRKRIELIVCLVLLCGPLRRTLRTLRSGVFLPQRDAKVSAKVEKQTASLPAKLDTSLIIGFDLSESFLRAVSAFLCASAVRWCKQTYGHRDAEHAELTQRVESVVTFPAI